MQKSNAPEPATLACVFLDRDGTLIEDVGYAYRPEQIQLLPGVREGLEKLRAAGLLSCVVTNQSGVARGYYSEAHVQAFHEQLNRELGPAARIDAFYYCPYHSDAVEPRYREQLHLRKPDIGMFEQACRDFPIAAEHSYLIGDRLLDMEFARRSGLRAILVPSRASEPNLASDRAGFLEAPNFLEAVARIVAHRAGGTDPWQPTAAR
jgi:D-glycero-D-manno-heptose 1,7-bisphosphate phosphatase